MVHLSKYEIVNNFVSHYNFTDCEPINCNVASKSPAFTLAETLITIGIIGVVAAMVVPILSSKVQDVIAANKRKKITSSLSQAYRLMMANEQADTFFDVPMFSSCNPEKVNIYDCFDTEHRKVISNMTTGAMGYDYSTVYHLDENNNLEDNPFYNYYTFTTPEGFVLAVNPYEAYFDSKYIVYADLNGAKLPNFALKDFFVFSVNKDGVVSDISEAYAQGMTTCSPYNYRMCKTQDECTKMGGQIWENWYHTEWYCY